MVVAPAVMTWSELRRPTTRRMAYVFPFRVCGEGAEIVLVDPAMTVRVKGVATLAVENEPEAPRGSR